MLEACNNAEANNGIEKSVPKGEALSASKILDLLPHHIYPTIIGSIQLENHIMELFSVQLASDCENSWGFTRTGRSIQ